MPRSISTTSVAIELDQPLVADPEVMRDLVEHDVPDLAAETIGVAGSESRDRPAEDADLVGKHSAVRAAPSRQRYAAVQAEQRLPAGGSSSTTISTLLIAAQRSAGKEPSASSIASSNGSLRPGSERASISAMVPESVLG